MPSTRCWDLCVHLPDQERRAAKKAARLEKKRLMRRRLAKAKREAEAAEKRAKKARKKRMFAQRVSMAQQVQNSSSETSHIFLLIRQSWRTAPGVRHHASHRKTDAANHTRPIIYHPGVENEAPSFLNGPRGPGLEVVPALLCSEWLIYGSTRERKPSPYFSSEAIPRESYPPVLSAGALYDERHSSFLRFFPCLPPLRLFLDFSLATTNPRPIPCV